jgi:hypothetical protein
MALPPPPPEFEPKTLLAKFEVWLHEQWFCVESQMRPMTKIGLILFFVFLYYVFLSCHICDLTQNNCSYVLAFMLQKLIGFFIYF